MVGKSDLLSIYIYTYCWYIFLSLSHQAAVRDVLAWSPSHQKVLFADFLSRRPCKNGGLYPITTQPTIYAPSPPFFFSLSTPNPWYRNTPHQSSIKLAYKKELPTKEGPREKRGLTGLYKRRGVAMPSRVIFCRPVSLLLYVLI